MTDEQISEMWAEAVHCHPIGVTTEKTISFARELLALQREADAKVCEDRIINGRPDRLERNLLMKVAATIRGKS